MKNYEADLVTAKINIKNYRFADEKEWRYVPSKKDAHMIIKKEIYQLYKDQVNNKIKHLRLKFEPKDIKYLIIDNDAEIPELIDFLCKAKGSKNSYNDLERLKTRLITSRQIIEDF